MPSATTDAASLTTSTRRISCPRRAGSSSGKRRRSTRSRRRGCVSLQYPQRFWRSDGASGVVVADLPFSIAWDATDSVPGPAGILTTFTTGRRGQQLARLHHYVRMGAVREQVVDVYGPVAAFHGAAATWAWSHERWTRGGYAHFAPGRFLDTWPILRLPQGRVHFAGEHTETLAGYMESAVRSGHRVARRIGSAPR